MYASVHDGKIVYQPVNPNTWGIGHGIYNVVGGIMKTSQQQIPMK